MGAPVWRCARERAPRNRLHLPDAPGLPQRPSWQLPDLRHAPQGGWCGSGNGRRRCRPRSAARRLQVSPERQQAIGVRLGVVSRLAGTRLLRTTGRVAPDENRTYPIVAAVSGWIRDVESVTTGDAVKKNQVLASFLAPDAEFGGRRSRTTPASRRSTAWRSRSPSRRRSRRRIPPCAAPR